MEWIDALKRGTALRFIDAVEPPPDCDRVRGVLGTSADGAWVLVDAVSEVLACSAELGDWRVLAEGPLAAGACFAAGLVVIAWRPGGLAGVDLDGNTVWSKAPPDASDDVSTGDHAIHHVCVNADGEIVVAQALGCVRWLVPKTGKERRRLTLDKRSGTLRRFDGETGHSDGPEYEAVCHEEIVGFDPSGRQALAWLPELYNGPHHPGDLRLRDFVSGSCTTVTTGVLHPGSTLLGPGARWAIAWSAWTAVDLWDLVERKHLGFRPVKASVGSSLWGPTVAMSPNGRHWVSAVDREICLWETSAESPIDRIKMPSYPPIESPMRFSPDGKTLYLCLEGRVVRMGVDPA